MSGNTIGKIFSVTTFGESHGEALGCIIDGCPPGLSISREEIQAELLREVGVYEYYVYERNREKQYPDLKEQLDMLYHDIMEDNLNNGRWIQTITAIKESNPKPDKPEPKL